MTERIPTAAKFQRKKDSEIQSSVTLYDWHSALRTSWMQINVETFQAEYFWVLENSAANAGKSCGHRKAQPPIQDLFSQ